MQFKVWVYNFMSGTQGLMQVQYNFYKLYSIILTTQPFAIE